MDAEAASGLADASAEFKQSCAQGFDLCRTPRLRQLETEQVDQVVGEAVHEQAEGVGQETMAAQAIATESILEFLDAVLALATIVVEGKDLRGAAGAVGDEETQVGSGRRVLGLVADAALV